MWTKLLVIEMLTFAGFTYHEAHAIYQEHVSAHDNAWRSLLIGDIRTGVVAKDSADGRLMLVTSRGL